MPRYYVDNAYNRRLGRVGMPHGSMVVTGSGFITTRTYVDNAQNRNLGRVGMFRGSMPEYECTSGPYRDYSEKYLTPASCIDDDRKDYLERVHVPTHEGKQDRILYPRNPDEYETVHEKRSGVVKPIAFESQCKTSPLVNVKNESVSQRAKSEPGYQRVKNDSASQRVKTESEPQRVKTEPEFRSQCVIKTELSACVDSEDLCDYSQSKLQTETVKRESDAGRINMELKLIQVKNKSNSEFKAMADDADPPERDCKDFKFQQLCKVRVTDQLTSLPLERGATIQASSKYGLTFVAMPTGFKVLRTTDFISQDAKHASDRLQHVITDFPVLADVAVPSGEKVTHLALSCDDLTLVAATLTTDHTFLNMYDVRNFAGQVTSPMAAFLKVNLSGAHTGLLDLAWNPVSPKLLVTCQASGRLDMYEISDKLGIRASVDNAKARCVCWSPKGKQLAVGREDGIIVQYDPDLNLKRKWDYPPGFPDQSYEAVDLMWLSTFSFMVAYISSGADCSDQPQLLLINGSKEGPTTYVNFEDVCFGMGEERQRKYFFNFLQKWDMLLAGQSNAAETVVVGKHLDNKDVWERWNLDDACRAECPLTDTHEDTFPMGIAVDFSSQTPIPLSEDRSLPPTPMMLLYTTDGLIIPYYMVYLHKDAPAITEPPQTLDVTGLRKPAGGANQAPPGSKPPSAVKNLFGSTSSQPVATSQALSKPMFPAATDQQSALKSALGGADTSAAKPGFDFGQGGAPFSFTSSTPKSGSGAAPFSFTPGGATGAPTTAATVTSGFAFGQNSSAPSFSFVQKSTASGSTDAVPTSTTGALGSSLGLKPTESGGQTTGFQFQVGAPPATSTQPTLPVPSLSQQQTTTAPPPAYGATTAPAFGSSTAPSFGASTAPGFGTSSVSAPSFGASTLTSGFGSMTASAAPGFSSTIGNSSSKGFGATTTKPAASTGSASFGAATANVAPFGSATSSATSFGSATSSAASFGSVTGVAAPFGSAATSVAGLGKTATSGGVGSGFGAPTASSGSAAGLSFSKPATTAAPAYSFGGPAASASESSALTKPGTISSTNAAATAASTQSAGLPDHSTKLGTLHKSQTQIGLIGLGQTASSDDPSLGPNQSNVAGTQDTSRKSPVDQSDGSTPSSQSVDHSFSRSILDEIKHFELELSELKLRSSRTDYTIGTSEEMTQLRTQTEALATFSRDMKKTMIDLNKDVQDQAAFCLDMFSSVEESRMRQQMLSDPRYHHLLKSRPLDPGSADKLQTLQQQYQVLDQGLRDVDLILDTQWEDYQNSKKNKSKRMQAPTNDAVYRVVKSNHNILVAQKAKLGQLEERLKQLKLYNTTVTWNTSNYSGGDKTELSTLADSLVSSSSPGGRAPSHSSSKEDYSTKTTSESSNNTNVRLAKLREHLYRRHVPVVRSTRPENLSMSKIALEDNQLWKSPEKVPKEQKSAPSAPPATTGVPQGQGQGKPGEFVGMFRRSTPGGPPVMNLSHTAPTGKSAPPTATQGGKLDMPGFGQTTLKFGPAGDKAFGPAGDKGFGAAGDKGFGLAGDKGFGLGKTAAPTPQQQQQAPVVVTRVEEVNGIRFEDVTPSGSEDNEAEGTEEEEEEEDDEYEDEESSSSNGNGHGFGLQYNLPANMPSSGILSGTPLSSRAPASKLLDSNKPPGDRSSPVSRNLFGNDKSKQADSIKFGAGDVSSGKPSSTPAAVSSKFSFGQPDTGASTSGQFSFGQQDSGPASSGGQFSFGQSGTTGSAAGFTFDTSSSAATSGGSGKDGKPGFAFGSTGSGTTAGFTGFTTTSSSKQKSETPQTTEDPVSSTSTSTKLPQSSGVFGQPSDADSSTDPSVVVAPSVIARSTRDEAASKQAGGSNTGFQGSNTGSQGFATTEGGSGAKPVSLFEKPDGSAATAATMPGSGFGFGQISSSTSAFPASSQTAETATVSSSTTDDVKQSATDASSSGKATSGLSKDAAGQEASVNTYGDPPKGGSPAVSTLASTPPSGLFGQPPSSTVASSNGDTQAANSDGSSIVSSTPSSTPPMGFFGQPASGNGAAAGAMLFGKPVVGTATETPETKPAAFGVSSTSTAPTGLFGSTSSASSTVSSTPFSMPVSTTSAASTATGLFGSTASATQGTSNALSSSSGLFGSSTASSSAPSSGGSGLFGQPASTASSGFGFGMATSTATSGTGTGLFGQPASSSGGGSFGQPSSSSGSSGTGLFGQTANIAGGLFGTPASDATTGGFGSSASSTSTTNSLFGQSTSGAGSSGGAGTGLFGSGSTGSTGFGVSTSSSGFGFGQSSVPASGFGQAPTFGQAPSPGGLFGNSGGGLLSGLGAKPSQEKANTNVFGSSQTFGQPGQSTSLFGSSSQSFGTQPAGGGAGGGAFSGGGGGAFSGGGQGVGSTGFSGLGQQSSAGGFGSAPAFGGSPAFGSAPGFGSAAKFGSPPAFGAGSTGFGGSPGFGGGATFGSSSTSGAQAQSGFAGFASAGSPTFGALAQSSDAPSFGGIAQGGGGGGEGGGGFGSVAAAAPGGFGSPPTFGGGAPQNQGFGGGSFGSSPSFSGYRG